MNKGYILHFDLQERGVNPLNPHMIFNELDNNTSDFFIVVTSGGKEVDIENADVTLAIIKPSGEAESQSIEIKDNCIYGNLKSYMKNEVGNYVASILLILDDQKVIIDEITYTITEDNVFRLLNDTVKEDERFPILTNMLNELYDIKIKEKQRELNEEQRIENENNRQNIFESKVNEVNSKINEVNKSKNEIVNTFNTLTAEQQQDAEVITARDGEVSLKARLDRDLNNLNKELDRVKKIEESKVSTIQTESNFTIIEETTNGYFEDIKLEGKTLVNLLKVKNDWICSSGTSSICYGRYNVIKQLEPGKTYTYCYFNLPSKITKAYLGNSTTSIEMVSWTTIDSMHTFVCSDDAATLTEVFPHFKTNNNETLTDSEIKNIKIMLLEGNLTNNSLEYFEGLMSIGEDVEEISIENTDNGNLTEGVFLKGTINTDTGKFIPVTSGYSFITKDIIPVFPLQIVKWKSIGERSFRLGGNTNLLYYDKNNNFLYKELAFTTFKDINIPSNCYGIRIMIADFELNTNTTEDEYKVYTTMSNNTTNINPIKKDKKQLLYYDEESQIWEKPILREWDTIEKHSNGKYYYHKRSEEIILNGTENWNPGIEQNITNRYQFLHNNIKKLSKLLCDKFLQINGGVDSEGISNHANINMLQLTLNKNKGDIRQWLQGNNVTVVYQLDQEKIYECTNIDLITYENETNYVVESGAITPKTTLKVHNNISNIVRLLQSKVSMLENNMTDYIVTQNRLLLSNRYSTDNVEFSVNTATFSLDDTTLEYDNDLYNLILDNILVGKDNYNRDYMENLIQFYWTTFIISDEMYFTLSNIIEEQYTEQEDITMEESPNEE